MREAVIRIRSAKLPDYRKISTAGSFFKNPILPLFFARSLKRQYPALPIYPMDEKMAKVSAAFLIDQVLHLKDFHLGKAYTYPNQALVICAEKNTTAKEVLALADYIKESVKNKTGILFEEEVEYVQ